MMIIDAHQHFWRYQAERDAWITNEMAALKRNFLPIDLQPEYHQNGVAGCVAVQADQSETETLFLLEQAETHSFIKGVVGWVDLRGKNVAERLEYFSRFEKLCGFRHVVQAEPDDNFMLREDFTSGIALLREFDFTYDILIYPKQLTAAIKLVEKFPDQAFVLDHLAKPFIKNQISEPWAAQIKELATAPNVSCKVSGLVTEAAWQNWQAVDFRPYLDVVFEFFGIDRIMFGSDWPVCLLAGSYKRVKELIADYTAPFSEAAKEKIFGLNAISFYRLKV